MWCTKDPLEQYTGIDGLLATVQSGAVAPLRGRWIVELAKDPLGRLRKRQELPAEAFWTHAQLDSLRQQLRASFGEEEGDRRFGRVFVALSYR